MILKRQDSRCYEGELVCEKVIRVSEARWQEGLWSNQEVVSKLYKEPRDGVYV